MSAELVTLDDRRHSLLRGTDALKAFAALLNRVMRDVGVFGNDCPEWTYTDLCRRGDVYISAQNRWGAPLAIVMKFEGEWVLQGDLHKPFEGHPGGMIIPQVWRRGIWELRFLNPPRH